MASQFSESHGAGAYITLKKNLSDGEAQSGYFC